MKAQLFDLGSRMVIDSTNYSVPGMDQGYYREINMEYDFKNSSERRREMNIELREAPTEGELRPWPEPFPWRCWVDLTTRYVENQGGFKITTYRLDSMTGDYSEVPEGLSYIELGGDYDPTADRESQRMNRRVQQEDIAAVTPAPTEWLHLPVLNRGGRADLKDPAVLHQLNHLDGKSFAVSMNNNPLFAPFDLSKPERYDVLSDSGERLSDDEKVAAMTTRYGSHYKLYLRPRNWRWVAHVYATYIYVSWFEMFYTTLGFTRAWFNRPPIYPARHDLIHTTQNPWWEYLHNYYSVDDGIDYGFVHSNGAAELRYEIIDQQWWTQSEAFIFYSNDWPTCVLWQYPPEPKDIVCGIGRVDYPTGEEQRVWVRQSGDLTDEYPLEVIGQYVIPSFQVTA